MFVYYLDGPLAKFLLIGRLLVLPLLIYYSYDRPLDTFLDDSYCSRGMDSSVYTLTVALTTFSI